MRDLGTGATSFASSAGLEFPPEFVGEWAEGGEEGTVGEVIAESTGCDKQDPHAHLSRGAFPRAALLEGAIKLALATLPLEVPGEGDEAPAAE